MLHTEKKRPFKTWGEGKLYLLVLRNKRPSNNKSEGKLYLILGHVLCLTIILVITIDMSV